MKIIIYDIVECRGKIWVHVRGLPYPSRANLPSPLTRGLSRIDFFAIVQLFMKAINNEAFFNFTFGTGKDKNIICELSEFVGSKVFEGDSSGDSSGSSSSA